MKINEKIKCGSIIRKCDCLHAVQYKLYGKQMRVMYVDGGGKSCKCTI